MRSRRSLSHSVSSSRTRNAWGWKFLRNCLSLPRFLRLAPHHPGTFFLCWNVSATGDEPLSEALYFASAWSRVLSASPLLEPGICLPSSQWPIDTVRFRGHLWCFTFACDQVASPLCFLEWTGPWRRNANLLLLCVISTEFIIANLRWYALLGDIPRSCIMNFAVWGTIWGRNNHLQEARWSSTPSHGANHSLTVMPAQGPRWKYGVIV